MTEAAKQFLEKVSADETLQAELTAALKGTENHEQIPIVIEFAKKTGCVLTREDFAREEADLSPDELETVNGGAQCLCCIAGSGRGDMLVCDCFQGGSGVFADRPSDPDKPCWCNSYGHGSSRIV